MAKKKDKQAHAGGSRTKKPRGKKGNGKPIGMPGSFYNTGYFK